jgi:hypothetical protein
MLDALLFAALSSIFVQKRLQEQIQQDTDYGWNNGKTSLQWLQFFAEQGRQAATGKV